MIPFRYALFAERQYQAVVENDETESLRRDMEAKRQEVSQLDSIIHSQAKGTRSTGYHQLNQDRRKAALVLDQDSQRYKLHVQKLDVFLRDSITMFSDCLRLSNAYDDDVLTRLCSLWFRNFDDPHVQEYINDAISTIPSWKFIFFVHQLTALLSTAAATPDPSQSTKTLHKLIMRLCREHPYHSLYQVHALKKGDGTQRNAETGDTRQQIANNLLNQLRGKNAEGKRLSTIEHICETYIEWSTWEIPAPEAGSQGGVLVPRSAMLVKLEAPEIPIPTVYTPVDPSSKYKNIVGIVRYASKYKTSGGVNLPKINDCYGTDGKAHRQVASGRC